MNNRFLFLCFLFSITHLFAQLPELLQLETQEVKVGSTIENQIDERYNSPRSTFKTLLEVKMSAIEGESEALSAGLGCLDLKSISPISRDSVGKKAYHDLIQTIDRLEEVILDDIPEKCSSKYWVYRKTSVLLDGVMVPVEISLHQVDSGVWLFTPETISSINSYYHFVRGRKVVSGVEGVVTFREAMLTDYPILGKKFLFFSVWQWMGMILLMFVATVLERVLSRVTKRFIQKMLETEQLKIHALKSDSFLIPLRLLIYAGVLRYGLDWLFLSVGMINTLQQTSIFLFTVGIVWMINILINIISSYFSDVAAKTENKFDDLLVPLLRKTSKLVVVSAGFVFLAENLWDNVSAILAGFGIGGLAVALAAKDTLANLFGSLTVLLDRPFEIGDWINIGKIHGSVEEVGFRSTRVRTFYNSLITIPNNMLTSTSIDNYGARSHRRFKTTLGIEYDTDPEKVEAFCEGIRQLIISLETSRKDYFHVYLNNLGASSLEILVYMFFDVPDWATELAERHRFLINILRLGNKMGINFAFPTQTIHHTQMETQSAEPLSEDAYLYGREMALDLSSNSITMKHPRSGVRGSEFPKDTRS